MKSKTIAASACCISPKRQKHVKAPSRRQNRLHGQHGVGLIELMIGITIGLLTVAVALGALMVSRGVSGTVSDSTQLQQQAAYAFRVISQQLRQAGSLRLNMAPQLAPGSTVAIDIADPVAFETEVDGFNPGRDTIRGYDTPAVGEFKLATGYRNYPEALYGAAVDESMQRNCLGEQTNDNLNLIKSYFDLDTAKNRLRCAGLAPGSSADPKPGKFQPFTENVANFQVRYLLQDASSALALGNPQISYVNATAVGTNWNRVQGVEVCLVLYGVESIDMPAGSSYTDCDGSTSVDMTTLTGTRAKRMHIVFRNVYQLRSQGLT